jgi:hypothetical protein
MNIIKTTDCVRRKATDEAYAIATMEYRDLISSARVSFEKWLEACVYPLFPDISPTWVYDAEGNVVKDPVIIQDRRCPGRLDPRSYAWRMRYRALDAPRPPHLPGPAELDVG